MRTYQYLLVRLTSQTTAACIVALFGVKKHCENYTATPHLPLVTSFCDKEVVIELFLALTALEYDANTNLHCFS